MRMYAYYARRGPFVSNRGAWGSVNVNGSRLLVALIAMQTPMPVGQGSFSSSPEVVPGAYALSKTFDITRGVGETRRRF